MRFANAVRVMLIVLLPVSLAGCFASEMALIGPGEAAYPFQTMTYTPDGEDDPVTGGLAQPLIDRIAGSKDQPDGMLSTCGHFCQEDRPVELAQGVIDTAKRAGFHG